jgi:hypothetical protein
MISSDLAMSFSSKSAGDEARRLASSWLSFPEDAEKDEPADILNGSAECDSTNGSSEDCARDKTGVENVMKSKIVMILM